VKEEVVLVDANDIAVGSCEKLEAHRKGLLHRAFSVFIFNDKGELLLQKRAASKYHSAGLWTNTCCGHPRPGEDIVGAAKRRLREEMGIAAELNEVFYFTYNEALGNSLVEHEYDHVFFGTVNAVPQPDPLEASDWKFVSCIQLKEDIITKPEQFTIWFRLCFDKVYGIKFPERK
jgi:isopentenyl-diphosphate delta-isomerase